jgi:hypothetical protein
VSNTEFLKQADIHLYIRAKYFPPIEQPIRLSAILQKEVISRNRFKAARITALPMAPKIFNRSGNGN